MNVLFSREDVTRITAQVNDVNSLLMKLEGAATELSHDMGKLGMLNFVDTATIDAMLKQSIESARSTVNKLRHTVAVMNATLVKED